MLTEMKQFSRFLKTAYFLPMLMSSVAIGILYKNILNPHFGVLASVLGAFGLKTLDLLGSRSLSLLTVSLIISWEYTPFYMVLFLSAITTISNDIREYAMIDGANRFQYYTSIVLPLLTGHVQTAIILSLIGSLKYFDLIFVLTNGGPANSTELLATYMYRMAFTSYKMGYGSAIAFALFAIVVIFSLTTQWISKKLNRDGNESW
jgi:raffinose/stachyose/melibiose transport system permease protein